MTFGDWISESRELFAQHPPSRAAALSASSFGVGGFKRIEARSDWHLGEPVWERDDWDICIILDACRVDVMREVAPEFDWLPDSIGTHWSPASMSPEWMDETFHDDYAEERESTIYINGNPFSGKEAHDEHMPPLRHGALPLDPNDFALLDETWRDHWSDDAGMSMPPEPLTDRAIGAWRRREEFDAERMIVHYMQPHIPFHSRPEWFGEGRAPSVFGVDGTYKDHWHMVRDGELPADEFWRAYRDNLAWVLRDAVAPLLNNADADVVITSDHGNGLGEWGVWSHPPGCPAPAVRRVPWLAVDADDHQTRVGEEPSSAVDSGGQRREDADPDGVSDRLEALGYV